MTTLPAASVPFTVQRNVAGPEAVRSTWEKIFGHSLDGPDQPGSFAQKLARDNGWTLSYAERVVEEYRRFCLLACVSDGMVVPSDAVDQAWHQHVLFTREYFEVFCPRVLGFVLHHGPSRGGVPERAGHFAAYQDTLALYRRTFGEKPPEALWPAPLDRFRGAAFVRVDAARAWVIRKPKWWPSLAAAAVALAWPAAPAWAMPANPLDWHGSEFLCLYLALLAVAVVFGVWGRRRFKGEGCAPSLPLRDPFDLAVMAKGPGRMVETALAMLSARGGVVLGGYRTFVRAGATPPKGSTPLEAHVWNSLETPLSVEALRASYAKVGKAKIADLRRAGLVPDETAAFHARLSAFLPLFALAGLGVAKICVGLSRGKSVEFLVLLAILTVVLSVVLASLPLRRTRQGDLAFAEAETACQANKHAADARWDAPVNDVDAPGRLGWQVALMGGSALALLGMSDLNRALYPPQQSGDGGSGGDSGGSSCGGGGDSGGGGGCGGCGGGGGD